jgi:hypothetical protein
MQTTKNGNLRKKTRDKTRLKINELVVNMKYGRHARFDRFKFKAVVPAFYSRNNLKIGSNPATPLRFHSESIIKTTTARTLSNRPCFLLSAR